MITVKPIVADGFVIIVDGAESIEQFKALVQRAANLWPDATPEIKEFADLITNGIVLQDYKSQNTSRSPFKIKPTEHGFIDKDGKHVKYEWDGNVTAVRNSPNPIEGERS